MTQKPSKQSYNDGACAVYAVTNGAAPGEKPVEALTEKLAVLRYENRVMGYKRFYASLQADSRADRVIRTPKNRALSQFDVVVDGGKQYRIDLIQYPPEFPNSMDLTLSRLEVAYELLV